MEEGQYLSFQGLNVFFRVFEPKGLVRHRILLIPGPMADTSIFDAIIPGLLSMNCLITAVDLPGFGKSAAGAGVPMGAKMRAQILWGILDAVDMRVSYGARSWNVLSHGSSIYASMEMAALNPESVISQIPVCPVFAPREEKAHRLPKEKEVFAWYDRTIAEARQFRDYMNVLYGKVLPAERLKTLHAPLLRPGVRDELPRLVREGYFVDEAHFGAFGPMMILRGDGDVFANRTFSKQIWTTLEGGGAEIHTVKKAWHFPTETNPDEITDYLRGWLKYIDE